MRPTHSVWFLCRLLLVLATGFVTGCGLQPAGLVPTLTPYPTIGEVYYLNISCADYICPTLQTLAAVYQRLEPNVILTVVPRAETLAYPLLTAGDVDIAVLSWLPSNRGENIWVQPIAHDGLAIIVHPQNGVPGLTEAQVQKLFQGQVENWEAWGGLYGAPQLISRETASGEFQFLQARVMREIRMSLNATLAPDSSFMLEYVQDDPLAVGYVSSALLQPDVRAVAIDGVSPGREAIRTQVYPLHRTIFVVTVGEPEEPVRGFIQWLLSEAGQTILYDHGFVSILD